MKLEDTILATMQTVAAESDSKLVSNICEATPLLESGLDSLGFAILVVKLEEELGYDPFVMMEDAVYPKTFGEFVEIYRRFAP
jgi:acyl carrier protein